MATTSFPKSKIKVLLLEGIHTSAARLFKQAGYQSVERLTKSLSEDDLIHKIKDVHIIGIRSKTQLSKKVIQRAEKLLGIAAFCIGTNQINLITCTERGIAVFNSPHSNTRSVAELVIAEAISLVRRIPEKNRAAHDGIWLKDARGCNEIRGKTLGIVGYGNIGSQVSVLAEAVGLNVMYYDVIPKLPLGNATAVGSLKQLLNQSDIVTLHVPGNASTKEIMNKKSLAQMKKGSILLNLSRGDVVNENDLLDAMKSKHLKGVGMDVYPSEPKKKGEVFNYTLQNYSNVILTPHIGGSTEEAQVNIGKDAATKLLQFLESGNSVGSLTVPELSLPLQENAHRILHMHINKPGVMSKINQIVSKQNINILGQYLKTNEQIGYAVLDVSHKVSRSLLDDMKKVKGTIRTRVLY